MEPRARFCTYARNIGWGISNQAAWNTTQGAILAQARSSNLGIQPMIPQQTQFPFASQGYGFYQNLG
jgi:hypothetical protein